MRKKAHHPWQGWKNERFRKRMTKTRLKENYESTGFAVIEPSWLFLYDGVYTPIPPSMGKIALEGGYFKRWEDVYPNVIVYATKEDAAL